MESKYLDSLSKKFIARGDEGLENKPNFLKLLYLFAYYHYFDADDTKLDEIVDGDRTKKETEDNIDGIYIDEESDNKDIDILISVPTDKPDTDFAGYYKNAEEAYFKAAWEKTGRPSLIDKVTQEDYFIKQPRGSQSFAESGKKLVILLITDLQPKFKDRERIRKEIHNLKPEHDSVSYEIRFWPDIESDILDIEDPKEFVEKGSLKINKADDILRYEDSIIVNASAKSIKALYQEYSTRGLFAQNLRYYVKNAKIDDSIVNSIQNRPEAFWYFNNGIIVICDGYEINGDEISLSRFSIINGGQTSYLIGETEFDQDFYVQCKIIKTKGEDDVTFISQVAEASNTQKPIKEKDLIANRPEQRQLKTQLANAGVFCAVKRGQKINKKHYTEAWQNTNNEEIGQFLFSFLYQFPCFARNNKSSLIGDNDRYTLIFKKKYPNDLLVCLLKRKVYYKRWQKKVLKDEESDGTKIGLVKNGRLCRFAIVGRRAKLYYHPEYFNQFSPSDDKEKIIRIFAQDDISHAFIKADLSTDKNTWYKVFDYAYDNIYGPGFQRLKNYKPNYNSYSNFTKTQTNYDTYILFDYLNLIKTSGRIPNALRQLFKDVFYGASEEEKIADDALLSQYTNYLVTGTDRTPLPEEVSKTIDENLHAYRTRAYRVLHKKAYEIFTNKQKKLIATYGPETVEELTSRKIRDKNQIENYGEDIVSIVRRVKNNL